MTHIVSLGIIPYQEVTWVYSTPIVNHLLMEVHPRLCAVVALHALYSQNQELNETNRDRTTTKDIPSDQQRDWKKIKCTQEDYGV